MRRPNPTLRPRKDRSRDFKASSGIARRLGSGLGRAAAWAALGRASVAEWAVAAPAPAAGAGSWPAPATSRSASRLARTSRPEAGCNAAARPAAGRATATAAGRASTATRRRRGGAAPAHSARPPGPARLVATPPAPAPGRDAGWREQRCIDAVTGLILEAPETQHRLYAPTKCKWLSSGTFVACSIRLAEQFRRRPWQHCWPSL